MSWDLRSRYFFDPSESQIAEGDMSPYGQQNSHANCVPSSFTAAILMAGYPDVDPEQIIIDEYGLNWRGGTEFTRSIDWITTHVANPPYFGHMPFDFDLADIAGNAGQINIIAGWVDNVPLFNVIGSQTGLSHASILAAHQDDDTFVIWNIWKGRFETYSRQTIADSLYEMAIMETKPAGGIFMALTDDQQVKLASDVAFIAGRLGDSGSTLTAQLQALWQRIGGSLADASLTDSFHALWSGTSGTTTWPALKLIPAASVDLSAVLSGIADLKAHPSGGDPEVKAILLKIETALKGA